MARTRTLIASALAVPVAAALCGAGVVAAADAPRVSPPAFSMDVQAQGVALDSPVAAAALRCVSARHVRC